jgi:signal peptidase I
VYTLSKSSYKKGDVITFQQKGNVSHRIVGEEVLGGATYYSTKGDANNISDSVLITDKNIYGKVFAVIPYVGEGILILKELL